MWHKNVQEVKHASQCKKAAESFRNRKLLCKVCLCSIVAGYLNTLEKISAQHSLDLFHILLLQWHLFTFVLTFFTSFSM